MPKHNNEKTISSSSLYGISLPVVFLLYALYVLTIFLTALYSYATIFNDGDGKASAQTMPEVASSSLPSHTSARRGPDVDPDSTILVSDISGVYVAGCEYEKGVVTADVVVYNMAGRAVDMYYSISVVAGGKHIGYIYGMADELIGPTENIKKKEFDGIAAGEKIVCVVADKTSPVSSDK